MVCILIVLLRHSKVLELVTVLRFSIGWWGRGATMESPIGYVALFERAVWSLCNAFSYKEPTPWNSMPQQITSTVLNLFKSKRVSLKHTGITINNTAQRIHHTWISMEWHKITISHMYIKLACLNYPMINWSTTSTGFSISSVLQTSKGISLFPFASKSDTFSQNTYTHSAPRNMRYYDWRASFVALVSSDSPELSNALRVLCSGISCNPPFVPVEPPREILWSTQQTAHSYTRIPSNNVPKCVYTRISLLIILNMLVYGF